MEAFDIVLGRRERWGGNVPFGLFSDDRRRGLYIIGQTGVGKSTLIRSMIRQDMAKDRACILLEPHNDLSEAVLTDVPKHRVRDTILVDPADPDYVTSINPFYRVPKDERPFVTSNLIATFRHIWPDNWGATRLQYILMNVIAALLDAPDYLRPTLLSIPLVLVNPHYRSKVVKHIENPQVRQFFERELARWNDRYLDEAVGPVLNRFGQIAGNPTLRNMLGQWRPALDVSSALEGSKIIIVWLAKGLIGEEEANYLGGIFVAAIQSAAMGRARIPETDRSDIPLYIDEFQTVTSTASIPIFTEGRKYGLMMTAANQILNQLQDDVRAAILGNVGSMVAFRTGADDAEPVARQIGLYDASNYRNLGLGKAYARMLVRGESEAPFRARTMPVDGGSHRRADAIRSWCRQRHCRKRCDVENEIARWFGKPWIAG